MGDRQARTALRLPLGVLLLSFSALAQGQGSVGGIYTCIDSKGRKLTSDRPIPECLDREQKVLNPSGTVRAKVGPSLTAQERADAEAREKQDAEVRAQQAEEKRRERALLIRYPTREVHDRERATAFAQVSSVAQAAQKRIDELALERRKLDQEMEFYKKDPSRAPPALRRQLEENDQGVLIQKRFIAEQENERQRVNARFDGDLERLQPLWAAQAGIRVSPTGIRKAP